MSKKAQTSATASFLLTSPIFRARLRARQRAAHAAAKKAKRGCEVHITCWRAPWGSTSPQDRKIDAFLEVVRLCKLLERYGATALDRRLLDECRTLIEDAAWGESNVSRKTRSRRNG